MSINNQRIVQYCYRYYSMLNEITYCEFVERVNLYFLHMVFYGYRAKKQNG